MYANTDTITETYPKCCILHGPSGEGIVDVVPGGMELEPLGLRRGVG